MLSVSVAQDVVEEQAAGAQCVEFGRWVGEKDVEKKWVGSFRGGVCDEKGGASSCDCV